MSVITPLDQVVLLEYIKSSRPLFPRDCIVIIVKQFHNLQIDRDQLTNWQLTDLKQLDSYGTIRSAVFYYNVS